MLSSLEELAVDLLRRIGFLLYVLLSCIDSVICSLDSSISLLAGGGAESLAGWTVACMHQ